MLNVELKIINKWTNQTNFCLQESTAKFIGACYKEGWSRYFTSSSSNGTAWSELGVPAEFEVCNFT